jgi:hypothetical protein
MSANRPSQLNPKFPLIAGTPRLRFSGHTRQRPRPAVASPMSAMNLCPPKLAGGFLAAERSNLPVLETRIEKRGRWARLISPSASKADMEPGMFECRLSTADIRKVSARPVNFRATWPSSLVRTSRLRTRRANRLDDLKGLFDLVDELSA